MEKGFLYLVGTPIGNLSDLSPRALEVLSKADVIAAEDTRHTALLLNHCAIKKPLESYHNFNKEYKGELLIEKLCAGRNVALVSDAGMPCISDPGAELVARCAEEGVSVVVIPGPCAAVTALSGSGLDSSKFVFEGFLPSGGKERKERLAFLRAEPRTIVFYEAPHRIRKTLADFSANGWENRRITLARELTKLHEEFIRTRVQDAADFYVANEPRGEYVLVLEGEEAFLRRCPEAQQPLCDDALRLRSMEDEIRRLVSQGESTKDISVQIAAAYSIPKKEAYAAAQRLKNSVPS